MIDYNMKVFGKVVIGIHKGELPKFSDMASTCQYWNIGSQKHNENSSEQSRKPLSYTRKHWRNNKY